jgi:Rrf2 family protein
MRLSEGVEWALHSCVVLASAPEGVSLPAGRLAEYHELPAAYLAKHLQALSRAGIVEPVPGRRGGYRLAQDPKDIKVSQIVSAIEGTGPAFVCTEVRQKGPAAPAPSGLRQACLIARVMWQAEQAWLQELNNWALADLAFAPGSEAYAKTRRWLLASKERTAPRPPPDGRSER